MHKKLRIGMLASNVIRIPPVPPEKYVPKGWSGAPELVVHHLTEELVRRGHDVTLFASGDSKTNAKLVSVTKGAMFFEVGKGPHEQYENMLVSKAYQMARNGHFDIIHSHFDLRSIYYAPLVDTPTISTLHSPLDGLCKEIMRHFKKTQYYASISDNQRNPIPDLQYAVTAYNGVEMEKIPFYGKEKKQNYFVFAGRVMDIKGVAEAIEVAQRTRMRLIIFGSVDEKSEYWIQKIKPFVDGEQIIYKGMVPREELFEYLGRARAFLFPLKWEEPFGLVTIEAMAAGTPTISFRRGSLPEIINDGKTGFLCDTIDEMIDAVSKVENINPADCRKRVEDMFTISKVVDRYEQAYYSILEKRI